MHTIRLPDGCYRYDPGTPLGRRGGFGQVFAGSSEGGQPVAVKRLHIDPETAGHRELEMAAALKNRSLSRVLPVLDAGEDAETGTYFVVMPVAEGSLQSHVEEAGPLTAKAAVEVLRSIAMGLAEVGAIVHRDLKPDNILHHDGAWKVADFGIARFVEDATSSKTLRDFLSPHYAAPEQWIGERATHATDVYALGCIAYFLLTGSVPFPREPQAAHLEQAFPGFECPDDRLKSLVSMMVRKRPEARASLSRVASVLKHIPETPCVPASSDAMALLASAGAKAAAADEAAELVAVQQACADAARRKLAASAYEILHDNCERLWGKVHAQAPAARRSSGNRASDPMFELGAGTFIVGFARGAVARDAFKNSGWDVVASAIIGVTQKGQAYQWSASLWYVKLPGSPEYRWVEVSYFMTWSNAPGPFACENFRDADLAAAPGSHTVAIAFGPEPVDDEGERQFHDRWIWLLSRAAINELQHPTYLPIRGWPPH